MAKIRRNSPCPCGSGVKLKKCCAIKKPRESIFSIDLDAPITKVPILVGEQGIINKWAIFAEKRYSRVGKHSKTINSLIGNNSILDLCRKKYDHVVAIDTNKWITPLGKIAVTTFVDLSLNDTEKCIIEPVSRTFGFEFFKLKL